MKMTQWIAWGSMVLTAWTAQAAGTLTPAGSGELPAEILSHDVLVTLNNGFARTEVTQQFKNVNPNTVEALYAFPLPVSASLSECSVRIGESVIEGEVLDKATARKIYGEEKSKGNQAALAEKDGYQDFTFQVANLAPEAVATVRFVYYQPLPVDTGVVRYLYPLQEGNTKDDAALNFWTRNDRPSGVTNMRVIVRSAWPLAGIRAPQGNVVSQQLDLAAGGAEASYELPDGLSRDFVFYYQLADDLPGRLEVIPFRRPGDAEGTFMMVLTPGIDLGKLENGADYIFVLDQSGSMSGSKLRTLADGVGRTLGQMNPQDRFRIVMFETRARELTSGWVAATPENAAHWTEKLGRCQATGSTNVYDGVKTALDKSDADRVTSIVLVTDGVTNEGIVAPKAFHQLLKDRDVRVFGFLMGNSANWPLMRVICDASGGFYDAVSNDDDIIGRIMLAKSKITSESLHDVKVSIDGVPTFDLTGDAVKKLYRGQQLVIFGRYRKSGEATVTMKVKRSGEWQSYQCVVDFPESDTDNPELERLWAMSRIEMFDTLAGSGLADGAETQQLIRDLGVKFQLVTDETSMVVLSDEAFSAYGVERNNRTRVVAERTAQSARAAQPVKNYRADVARPERRTEVPAQPSRSNNSMFRGSAPRLGGGALEPVWILVLATVAGVALAGGTLKKNKKEKE